jgi:hypothetical protein
MSRLYLVPCLVVGVFLSGCKSAQQGGDGPVAPVVDGVQNACAGAYQRCEDWVEAHPAAKTAVYVTGFVILTAAVAAVVAVCLYAELTCDH